MPRQVLSFLVIVFLLFGLVAVLKKKTGTHVVLIARQKFAETGEILVGPQNLAYELRI